MLRRRWGFTPFRSSPAATAVMFALALALTLAFAWLLLAAPRTPGRMERESAELVDRLPVWSAAAALEAVVPTTPASVLLVAGSIVTAAFAAYSLAIVVAWTPASPRIRVIALVAGVVFLVLPVFAMPNHQTDLWDYVAYGRLAATYGVSPYEVTPSAFPSDPILPYTSETYRTEVDNKLPVWTAMSTAIASIGGADPIGALLTYRVAFSAMNLASLLLVVVILRRLAPEREAAGIVVWSWNPVVATWGHKTDALVVLLLLGAVVLLVTSRAGTIVPLTLSALVKLLTAPLVVIEVIAAARRDGIGRAALVALVAAGLTAAVYLPYTTDPSLVVEHARLASRGGSPLPDELQPAAVVAYVGVVLWLAWTVPADPRSRLLGWAFAMLFAAVLVPPSLSWYFMSLVALTAVAARVGLVAVVVPLTFVSYLIHARSYLFSADFAIGNVLVPTGLLYMVIAALLVLGAVAVVRERRPIRPPTSQQ